MLIVSLAYIKHIGVSYTANEEICMLYTISMYSACVLIFIR